MKESKPLAKFSLAAISLIFLIVFLNTVSAEDLSSFNVRQVLVRADQNYDGKLDQTDRDIVNNIWRNQTYDERADVNKDGIVNLADRSIVNSWWRERDFNGDGYVSIIDYLEEVPFADIIEFGDVNDDGKLDEEDVDYVNSLWINQEYEEKADFIYDKVINVADRSFVNYLVETYANVQCSETDNGIDYFTKGAITGILIYEDGKKAENLEDVCTLNDHLTGSCEAGENCKIVEYYCEDGWAKIDQYQCPGGCSNGACLGEHLCAACINGTPTGEYDSFGCMIYQCPTEDDNRTCDSECHCVMKEVEYQQCVQSDCSAESLRCQFGCDHETGECRTNENQEMTEQTTCHFSNSEEKHNCCFNSVYGGEACCEGEENCTIDSFGTTSNKLIWKSDCGGNAETILDGIDEEIYFDCNLNGCDTIGLRKNGQYCSNGNFFIEQSIAGATCENSFECQSNLCINSECVSGNLWQKFLNWFKRVFG